MTFEEITNKLLSLPNCSITVGGCLFIQDLHKYVNDSFRYTSRLRDQMLTGIETPWIYNPFWVSWDEQSKKTITFTHEEVKQLSTSNKENLTHILNNYETARRAPVGNKRPR